MIIKDVFILLACLIGAHSADDLEGGGLDNRISGGEEATNGIFYYQASLRLQGSHVCGGTLVTLRDVITASHCFLDQEDKLETDPKLFDILAGTLDSTSTSRDNIRNILRITTHPNFNHRTFRADIAAIRLVSSFALSDTLAPIRPLITPLKVGTNCVISGWGYQTEDGPDAEKILRYAIVPLADQIKCGTIYNATTTNKILNDMTCAGNQEGGKDSCTGDSGGPLVCDGYLTGIVSFGLGCARAKYFGVYSRVEFYRHWIYSMVNQRERPMTQSTSRTQVISERRRGGAGRRRAKRLASGAAGPKPEGP